ncbi:Ferrochelatase, protoheme ferro-lyase [Crocosphaera watsonii WH 0402]|uniref:Ferrochelatase, protoheme ferro-lyase n=2 Tax=Crocosphaera watsonii TaxID=263511 RepID=T2JLC9_CROWT|nr:Ferrochelatase, protoheme ferro-lyase [Crocosphaera watsonii WH 0402]
MVKSGINFGETFSANPKVELLGRTKSEEAISELEKALNDSDEYVRGSAAYALGNIGSDQAISELEKALNDSDEYVRGSAAYALGNIGSDQAIESLSTFLLKGDWQYYNNSFSNILNALETIQDKCQIYQIPPPLPPKTSETSDQSQTVNYYFNNSNVGNVAHKVQGHQNTEQS